MTEETLFELALRTPDAERSVLLDRACQGKPELRARVEALLQADGDSSPFSKPSPAIDITTGFEPTHSYTSTDATPGILIAGRYTLEQKLGEGGMGEVWVAKQSEPVKRKVALKLIKAGMDSKSVLQRFEQERQALALMDHPNIAKVLDGGITADRRPFFVMELVNGAPLTRFCDEARLGVKERLELFVPICHAVQHAHQKGIVHRDLKPGNILVTLIDSKPVPKVIDFGVAKATSGRLTEESLSTQFGAVVGTLEYMSPEQAGFSGDDIDTRADIYSLGVILYELLTGLRPIDSNRLKKAALTEMIRIIQEEEPSKPSTRLSTDQALQSMAAVRQIDPKKLTSLLRGELDWVVMKCLEKQRDRRYETANGLARDIQRYLADEPVEAKPPSFKYRAGKFLRRHKGPVIAASVVLVAMLAGVVGTTLGLVEAKRQEGIAREQEIEAKKQEGIAREEARAKELARAAEAVRAEGERKARLEEERQRKFAQAIADFVRDDFLAMTSVEGQERFDGQGLDRNATLATLLDRAATKLKARKDLDPLIEAELRWIIGVNLRGIGELNQALSHLERSVEIRNKALGRDHGETLVARNSLAVAYAAAGKPLQAKALNEENLALAKTRLGPDHPFTIICMNNVAGQFLDEDKYDQAIPLYEESFHLAKAKLGPKDSNTLMAMANLGKCYSQVGKYDLALPLLKDSLRYWRQSPGESGRNTLVALSNLGEHYNRTGHFDLALPLLEEALTLSKSLLGPEHPHTIMTQVHLGAAHKISPQRDRGVTLLEEAHTLARKKFGVDHRQTISVMAFLAEAYMSVGKANLAGPLLQEALQISRKQHGEDHLETLAIMTNLAGTLKAVGKNEEAAKILEDVLKRRTAILGSDHPDLLRTRQNLAVCYWGMGRYDKSVPLLEELLQKREKLFGRKHPFTQVIVANLGVNYKDSGRIEEALPLLEEAHQSSRSDATIRWVTSQVFDAYVRTGRRNEALRLLPEVVSALRNGLPPGSPALAGALAQLCQQLMVLKAFTETEPLLRECLAIREKQLPDAWSTFNTQSMLGGTLLGQKKYSEAESLLLKGYEGLKQREKSIPPQGKVRLPEALDRLILLYTETNKPDEVKKWQAEKKN